MFGVHFQENKPGDYREWSQGQPKLYDSILEVLVWKGAMPDPDSREPWFFCRDHSEQDIADTLTLFEEATKVILG